MPRLRKRELPWLRKREVQGKGVAQCTCPGQERGTAQAQENSESEHKYLRNIKH